uniref:Uncharacterized protein n=1 Tax=virus sp. ctmTa7 TaxID=2828255 RepID=A0A8S5RBY1_9VIRU|nr:MAG TPA: hypothetical protein [virus sp. ctmTa7]
MKFDNYLKEQLQDPEFKKEWDGTQEEYAAINDKIKANALNYNNPSVSERYIRDNKNHS